MGVTYKKRPDQDVWETDIRGWRIEIQQDENGDWLWTTFDTNWKGPLLEMKGKSPTQRKAEWAAQQWTRKLAGPGI